MWSQDSLVSRVTGLRWEVLDFIGGMHKIIFCCFFQFLSFASQVALKKCFPLFARQLSNMLFPFYT